jgi:hypothetical protein
MPRSTEDIIEEIESELRPLKRRMQKPSGLQLRPPREEIKAHIAIVSRSAQTKLPNARSVRDKARRALPLVRALEGEFPLRIPYGSGQLNISDFIEPLTHLEGPDPRLDALQFYCGHQALVLIEQLSKKPVAMTPGGNAHTIAQLLFEAVTGELPSATGLLQAGRKAKRFRDGDLTTAPLVVVRGYFTFGSPKRVD